MKNINLENLSDNELLERLKIRVNLLVNGRDNKSNFEIIKYILKLLQNKKGI